MQKWSTKGREFQANEEHLEKAQKGQNRRITKMILGLFRFFPPADYFPPPVEAVAAAISVHEFNH